MKCADSLTMFSSSLIISNNHLQTEESGTNTSSKIEFLREPYLELFLGEVGKENGFEVLDNYIYIGVGSKIYSGIGVVE
jgi:hypothetical protein